MRYRLLSKPVRSTTCALLCVGIAAFLVLAVSVAPSNAQPVELPHNPACNPSYNRYIAQQTCAPCNPSYNELILGYRCSFYFALDHRPPTVAIGVDDNGQATVARPQVSRQRPSTAAAIATSPASATGDVLVDAGSDAQTVLAITGIDETTPVASLLLLGLGSFFIALSRTRQSV